MSALPSTRYAVAVDEALREASAEQLRRALKNRTLDAARQRALNIDEGDYVPPDDDTKIEDVAALDEAAVRWRRGDKREALHHLEYALGREFTGLSDLRPEDLR